MRPRSPLNFQFADAVVCCTCGEFIFMSWESISGDSLYFRVGRNPVGCETGRQVGLEFISLFGVNVCKQLICGVAMTIFRRCFCT